MIENPYQAACLCPHSSIWCPYHGEEAIAKRLFTKERIVWLMQMEGFL